MKIFSFNLMTQLNKKVIIRLLPYISSKAAFFERELFPLHITCIWDISGYTHLPALQGE